MFTTALYAIAVDPGCQTGRKFVPDGQTSSYLSASGRFGSLGLTSFPTPVSFRSAVGAVKWFFLTRATEPIPLRIIPCFYLRTPVISSLSYSFSRASFQDV
ncbi:hypothetical protein BaRGS_00006241 [Batillaria attramentaria]|uniref:Uncharacterized protein n=1 Tax=Batillaria attramentaria TaxID=370345 RepID=A0ABD0LUC4_9CAEN